jgi:outer membrane protein
VPKRFLLFSILFSVWAVLITADVSAQMQNKPTERSVYSLDDLYRLALSRSEEVGISKEKLYLAHETRKKAFSVLVPELSAFGSHTRYGLNDTSIDLITVPDSATAWGLQLSQKFTLNGKELIALRVTGESIEKSTYDLSAVKEEFLLGVAAAYVDVLKSTKALEIAEANVTRLSTYRDAVAVKLRLEEVAKTDMFRAEAELSRAKAELISAENQLKYAKALLSQLTGLRDDYEISDMEPQPDPTKGRKISQLKEIAYNHRAELKALKKQQDIAEDQVRYYRSEYWPTVSIDGSYSKTKPNPSGAFILNEENLSIGLTVRLPLYDGGLKKAQVHEAISKKRQADLSYRSVKKRIELEVENSYLSVISARSMTNALTDQVRFARSDYDAVLTQYNYGLANSVDIMDANTLLVTAERQLSEAHYTYQLAILKLNRAQGLFLSSLEKNGKL